MADVPVEHSAVVRALKRGEFYIDAYLRASIEDSVTSIGGDDFVFFTVE
jgi:hypothetical protein